jgi:hypothetical protein
MAMAPLALGAHVAEGAVTSSHGPTWHGVGDDHWWGSATADDLGQAWATARAEAAVGDHGTGRQLRRGPVVVQGGTA